MKRTRTKPFNWLKSYSARWTSTFDRWTRALPDGAINGVIHRISDHKGVSSMNSDEQLRRTWQQIAEEVTKETDPSRVMQLSQELLRALDERQTFRAPPRGFVRNNAE